MAFSSYDPLAGYARQQALLGIGSLGGHRYGSLGQAPSSAYGYPYSPPGPGYYGTLGSLGAQQEPVAPAEPIEDAGIRAGEIIGWRCWRLEHGLLRSMVADTVWAPGEPMEGKPDDHGVYGVNACRTQSGALTYGFPGAYARAIVVGQVEMWGQVIEHEDGYRSEFAQIVSLCRLIEGDDRLDDLRLEVMKGLKLTPRRSLLDRLLLRPAAEPPAPPAPPPTAEERLARLQREYGVGSAAPDGTRTERDL